MGSDSIIERMIPGNTPAFAENEHLERYKFARQFVQNKHVLDIACGAGYGSAILVDAGAESVQGVDLDKSAVAFAQKNYAASNIRFEIGDITIFNPGTTYDVITCFETIEHVSDYQKALLNLYQLLKPDGQLIISTPNRPMSWRPVKSMNDKPHNPHHVREFDLKEFKSILKESNFRFEDSDIYSQRPHIYIRNRYLRKIYHEIFKPYTRANPVVQPIGILSPMYIVIVAHKGGT